MTDLMVAVVNGASPREVQKLLDAGEDANARVENGWTAILLAGSHCDNVDTIRVLIEAGADIHAVTDEGVSVLHAAAMVNNADVAALLVQSGADVEATTNNGTTPVMVAVSHGAVEVFKVLLEAGADLTRKNAAGMTVEDMLLQNDTGADASE
jgi:ankyrin repeat protein